jgi:DNA-3-methyladenine glycosylase I
MDASDLGTVTGGDGRVRCWWCVGDSLLERYHDEEWGRPLHDDVRLFELLSLEAFQSGLSWLTILRKREAFRAAFAGFVIEVIAGYGEEDVARLLADQGIVRNRAKIEAAIANARAARELGSLDELVWSFAPPAGPAPRTASDIPSTTPESVALARELRRRGFRFVGPTIAYALMQSAGLVNDHVAGCEYREA